MALSATSKNALTALLAGIVAKDPEFVSDLQTLAQRRLSSTDRTNLIAILPIDGWSQTPVPAGATALATLIADIAAN